MSKFKIGDKVRILANVLTPSSVGKIGEVVKVYESRARITNDSYEYKDENVYRVRLIGHKTNLRGVADESSIELAD